MTRTMRLILTGGVILSVFSLLAPAQAIADLSEAPLVRPAAVQAADVTVPRSLVGFYYVHAGGMTVRRDGVIKITYQRYLKRDKGLPSFPRVWLKVKSVHGTVLRGTVTGGNGSPVPVGTRFTAIHAAPGYQVRWATLSRAWRFCDPAHQARGECGA